MSLYKFGSDRKRAQPPSAINKHGLLPEAEAGRGQKVRYTQAERSIQDRSSGSVFRTDLFQALHELDRSVDPAVHAHAGALGEAVAAFGADL